MNLADQADKLATSLESGSEEVESAFWAESLSRALVALGRAQRVCVQVVSPDELHAPDAAAVRLRDAESGDELEVQLDDETRTRFAREAEKFLEERAQLATRHGARFTRIAPDADLVAAVEEVLVT